MLTDAGKLTKALQNAQRLYGQDVIICPFDLSLEPEAMGCEIRWENDNHHPLVCGHLSWENDADALDSSNFHQRGRMPVVLEAFRRLKVVLGKNVPLGAVIAGPLTLAEKLCNSDIALGFKENPHGMERFLSYAARISLTSCKAFCEVGPDIMFIIDDQLHRIPESYLSLVYSLFRPIVNTIRFYNAYCVLITNANQKKDLDFLLKLDVDGVILCSDISKTCQELRQMVKETNMIMGIAIPNEILTGSEAEMSEFLRECFKVSVNRKVFLTTEWEMPLEAKPENIHLLMSCISGLTGKQ